MGGTCAFPRWPSYECREFHLFPVKAVHDKELKVISDQVSKGCIEDLLPLLTTPRADDILKLGDAGNLHDEQSVTVNWR